MHINIRLEYFDCNQVCLNVILKRCVCSQRTSKQMWLSLRTFRIQTNNIKNEAEVPHYYNKIPAMLRARTLRRELDECNVIQNANLD
jgi:hypothetical protein